MGGTGVELGRIRGNSMPRESFLKSGNGSSAGPGKDSGWDDVEGSAWTSGITSRLVFIAVSFRWTSTATYCFESCGGLFSHRSTQTDISTKTQRFQTSTTSTQDSGNHPCLQQVHNLTSVSGLVVKSIVAIDGPRVRFAADAFWLLRRPRRQPQRC